MRAWILAAACVLAACSSEAPSSDSSQSPGDGAETAQARVLSCDDFAGLTPATLAERFGAENVSIEERPGAEGDFYDATFVFANDPANRMEIGWDLDGERLAFVSVRDDGTQWRGSDGYTMNSTLAQIERMNGRAFQVYGFGWDYGGWVASWSGGALQYAPTCRAHIRFGPRGREANNAMGDSEFSSDTAAIRAADPVVREFGLTFPNVQ